MKLLDGKPIILDTFCGAGGVARGYQLAGFYIVGVDHKPQPRYAGDEFHQADALVVLRRLIDGEVWQGYHLGDFAALHASPPCQLDCAYRRRGDGVGDGYADLIAPTRELLAEAGLPWVIENVVGARRKLREPVQVCGTGLALDVQRHRLFESNVPMMGVGCAHGRHAARFPGATNRLPGTRRTVEVGVWRIPLDVQQAAMGIDWMTLAELSDAIPPAFTQHIGFYLLAEIEARAKVAA